LLSRGLRDRTSGLYDGVGCAIAFESCLLYPTEEADQHEDWKGGCSPQTTPDGGTFVCHLDAFRLGYVSLRSLCIFSPAAQDTPSETSKNGSRAWKKIPRAVWRIKGRGGLAGRHSRGVLGGVCVGGVEGEGVPAAGGQILVRRRATLVPLICLIVIVC